MATNQTIDGVPRALLERLLHNLPNERTKGELRALLDAPVAQASNLRTAFDALLDALQLAGHEKEFNEAIGRYKYNQDAFELFQKLLRAAQPQGEPIYQTMYRGDGGGGGCDAEKDSYDMKVPHPKHWRTRIVYAEQPAPVAVALPERMPGIVATDSNEEGWNACLDEVARLNGGES